MYMRQTFDAVNVVYNIWQYANICISTWCVPDIYLVMRSTYHRVVHFLTTLENFSWRTYLFLRMGFNDAEHFYQRVSRRKVLLTHWDRDRIATIYQTTSLKAFSWIKIYVFWLKFHLILLLRVELTTLPQIMAWRRSGDRPLSEPMMVRLLTHICVTWVQWVKSSQAIVRDMTLFFHIKGLVCMAIHKKYVYTCCCGNIDLKTNYGLFLEI